jgi:DUF971 family protein
MTAPPQLLRALRDRRVFQLAWQTEPVYELGFWELRCACTCAACVDEITGRAILQPERVDREVAPVKLELSGNYALKITWSDGHNTGLFTWDRLQQLCELAGPAAERKTGNAD